VNSAALEGAIEKNSGWSKNFDRTKRRREKKNSTGTGEARGGGTGRVWKRANPKKTCGLQSGEVM